MVQVCPSRQFPLGVSMSLPRRQALLEWAERAGGVIVIAPTSLRRALHTAKQVADGPTPLPLQAAAAQFIDQGLLARHARRMRRVYAERHQLLGATLEHCLADHLAAIPSAAGPHLAALLRGARGRDDTLAVDHATAAGVAVQALSRFAVTRRPEPGLLFSLGAIPTDRIHEGLRQLHPCLEALATVA
jgi:GntR family transcriptional regulator / MocR family aminotransferase